MKYTLNFELSEFNKERHSLFINSDKFACLIELAAKEKFLLRPEVNLCRYFFNFEIGLAFEKKKKNQY